MFVVKPNPDKLGNRQLKILSNHPTGTVKNKTLF